MLLTFETGIGKHRVFESTSAKSAPCIVKNKVTVKKMHDLTETKTKPIIT